MAVNTPGKGNVPVPTSSQSEGGVAKDSGGSWGDVAFNAMANAVGLSSPLGLGGQSLQQGLQYALQQMSNGDAQKSQEQIQETLRLVGRENKKDNKRSVLNSSRARAENKRSQSGNAPDARTPDARTARMKQNINKQLAQRTAPNGQKFAKGQLAQGARGGFPGPLATAAKGVAASVLANPAKAFATPNRTPGQTAKPTTPNAKPATTSQAAKTAQAAKARASQKTATTPAQVAKTAPAKPGAQANPANPSASQSPASTEGQKAQQGNVAQNANPQQAKTEISAAKDLSLSAAKDTPLSNEEGIERQNLSDLNDEGSAERLTSGESYSKGEAGASDHSTGDEGSGGSDQNSEEGFEEFVENDALSTEPFHDAQLPEHISESLDFLGDFQAEKPPEEKPAQGKSSTFRVRGSRFGGEGIHHQQEANNLSPEITDMAEGSEAYNASLAQLNRNMAGVQSEQLAENSLAEVLEKTDLESAEGLDFDEVLAMLADNTQTTASQMVNSKRVNETKKDKPSKSINSKRAASRGPEYDQVLDRLDQLDQRFQYGLNAIAEVTGNLGEDVHGMQKFQNLIVQDMVAKSPRMRHEYELTRDENMHHSFTRGQQTYIEGYEQRRETVVAHHRSAEKIFKGQSEVQRVAYVSPEEAKQRALEQDRDPFLKNQNDRKPAGAYNNKA